MTKRNLAPEIVSLIHHVELNESGWWKKAIGQVIKCVLWKHGEPINISGLRKVIKNEIGVNLSEAVLGKQLDILCSQQAVAKLNNQNYKLTEKIRNELNSTNENAAREGEECKRYFINSCSEQCPELDPLKVWSLFQSELINTVSVLGANLYHLLNDGKLERDVNWLSGFLKHFDESKHEGLRRVLTTFFLPTNCVCRKQILRLMAAHFFAEASQLRPETIEAIENNRTQNKQRIIKVVLDTNLIFSLLKLHDNPADDSALSLLDISRHSGGNLVVKLYVLPSTIEEAQRALTHQMRLLERIRTTNAIVNAALKQPLPSIAKKFLDSTRNCPGISAETFFKPYIDDLKTILLGQGIKILDANPSVYNIRQDVIDDIKDEIKREEQEIPIDKRKGYETHLHDIVLWHAINDHRATSTESLFDVVYWVVSIDWRLINFDRRKRAKTDNLPIVLHPSNLIQLIQFWVPRTKELENGLVDSLRLPLFFDSFDPEDEKATIKVLEALSRFENISDLPESAITPILANRALRTKLREADASNDEIFELIRDELLTEYQAAISQLEETRREKIILHENIDEINRKIEDTERVASEIESASKLTELNLKSKIDTIESKHARFKYIIFFIASPFLLSVALGVTSYLYLKIEYPDIAGFILVSLIGFSAVLPLSLSCMLSPLYTNRTPIMQNWWIVKALNLIGRSIIIPLIALSFQAIYQGGIWDLIKSQFDLQF